MKICILILASYNGATEQKLMLYVGIINIFNNTNQVLLTHGYFEGIDSHRPFDRPGSIAAACYFIKLKYLRTERNSFAWN